MDELHKTLKQIQDESDDSAQLEIAILSKLREIMTQKVLIRDLKQDRILQFSDQYSSSLAGLEGLSNEYLDIIRLKQDILSPLRIKLAETDAELVRLTEQSDSLFEIQTQTIISLHQANISVLHEEFANVPAKLQRGFAEQELKNLEILIKEAESIHTKTENTLSTVLIRTADHQYQGGGIVDLENSITNITAEIESIEAELQENLMNLAKQNGAESHEQQMRQAELQATQKLYGWSDQKRQIEQQLGEIKRNIATNKQQVENVDRLILLKEKRLKTLQTLTAKHLGKVDSVEIAEGETIDVLISRLDRVAKSSQSQSKRNEISHESLVIQNNEAARVLDVRLREIQQVTALANRDIVTLKKEIATARSEASDREAALVKSLRALRVKSLVKDTAKSKAVHHLSPAAVKR
jgi:hypothetical protein